MSDLRRGGRLDDRLGVGQANVLGGQDAEPPRDENRVGTPSIIRASQYNAALASELRTDLIKAEARL